MFTVDSPLPVPAFGGASGELHLPAPGVWGAVWGL